MNFIIGDPHGCYRQLVELVAEIRKRDADATIWCTGDLCDRGPDTRGVVDLVIRENIKVVRGNHDDIFDCILSGEPTATTDDQSSEAPFSSLDWFRHFGMYETFASYGQDKDAVNNALKGKYQMAALASKVPQEHHKFFENLPLILEGDGFFVAHASVVPELPLSQATDEDIYRKALIWGRYTDAQIKQEKVWDKVGYFGHTPTFKYGPEGFPVFGNKVVLVDTGAVFNKGLTAVCHETQEVITVH